MNRGSARSLALVALTLTWLAPPPAAWGQAPPGLLSRVQLPPDQLRDLAARSFFSALTHGQVDGMLPLCAERVSFEGRWLAGEEQLRPALARLGERAQLRSLQLVDLHILSVEAMVARFGPPPERLRDAIRRGDSIVLARFNQQGAIAVMAKAGRFWRIKALTD